MDVTLASSELRDSKILRVNKICEPNSLRVYNIAVRDCNFYLDVTGAKWETRDCNLLRVCNFYVDVTQASCVMRVSQILRVYKISDSKILCAHKIAVRGCNSGQVRNTRL